MVPTDPSAAQLILSGRALALQRRQAMAQHGKAAAGPRTAAALKPAAAPAVAAAPRPAMATLRPASAPQDRVVVAAAPSAARQRRQALSQSGKASGLAGTGGRTRAEAGPEARTQVRPAGVVPKAWVPAAAAAVRPAESKSCDCGGGCKADSRPALAAPATPVYGSLLRSALSTAAAVAPEGRSAAMQRRQALSQTGAAARVVTKAAVTPSRPTGRVRPARAETTPVPVPVPPKVGLGHTLRGRAVTGTMVDSSRKLTGTERGQCRSVTGTEYLGQEPFDSLCGTRPAPGPAKVGESHTLRDQRVTGTEVGRSKRHTGDEHGACKPVTGTEYLGQEHNPEVCGTRPPEARPHKVSVMSTAKGQSVSGASLERSVKVTGDERGAQRSLTGTGFQSPSALPSLAPPKVGEMATRGGRSVTGTDFSLAARVTGDDRGACRGITGSDYLGTDQQQAVCEAPQAVVAVPKVGVDHTLQGQAVTGTQVGRSGKVTGDEHGGCAPVSGTPYIGRQQFGAHCSPEQQSRLLATLPQRITIPAARVSGDRPGAGGSAMTGDERGACLPVSGTRYVGRDNSPASCPPVVPRWLPRAEPSVAERPAPPADFSIVPPARQMQQRSQERAVTGSAAGTQRITGPVDKASGMVTGTPEFRHMPASAAAAPASAAPAASLPAAQRLTGEGSQAGPSISGDAWQGKGRVTGTEGTSSLSRNPSQRGPVRGMGPGMGMNAMRWREEVERPELPASPVTGSSGSTLKGAAITVSGGARA